MRSNVHGLQTHYAHDLVKLGNKVDGCLIFISTDYSSYAILVHHPDPFFVTTAIVLVD